MSEVYHKENRIREKRGSNLNLFKKFIRGLVSIMKGGNTIEI